MRPRRSDDALAVLLALLVHVAIVAVLFAGLWWTRSASPASAAGGVQAELVDAGALPASMRRALSRTPEAVEPEPVPEPEPEPLPEPAEAVPEPQPVPQEQLPDPATEDQDEVVDAPTPVRAVETRVQEEKRRQEQVDLTAERERQERAQQLAREREAQLAEIRRKRAAAARDARLAQERLEQLNAARPAGSAATAAARADAAASGAGDDDLKGRYAAALQEAITAKWTRPESIPPGALCSLVIRQLPGGEVVDVQVSSPCVYDEAGRRSIEAAVLKAQPLPYAGFEAVFQRNLRLNFRAD